MSQSLGAAIKAVFTKIKVYVDGVAEYTGDPVQVPPCVDSSFSFPDADYLETFLLSQSASNGTLTQAAAQEALAYAAALERDVDARLMRRIDYVHEAMDEYEAESQRLNNHGTLLQQVAKGQTTYQVGMGDK